MIEREVELDDFQGFLTYIESGIFWLTAISILFVSIILTIFLIIYPSGWNASFLVIVIFIIFMWIFTYFLIKLSLQISKYNKSFRGGKMLHHRVGNEGVYTFPIDSAIEIISKYVGEVYVDEDFYNFNWASTQVVMRIRNRNGLVSFNKQFFHDATISPGFEKDVDCVKEAMRDIRREMFRINDDGKKRKGRATAIINADTFQRKKEQDD